MARDVMSDLIGVSKKTTPPSVVKGAAKQGTPKVPPVKAPSAKVGAPAKAPPPPKGTPAKGPPQKAAAGTVDRGAVVKRTPGPRQPSKVYADGQRISTGPKDRNYKTGGNVEKAVKLMEKHKTVGAYQKAMADTENPLPAIGLLRYLEKKGAVTVT